MGNHPHHQWRRRHYCFRMAIAKADQPLWTIDCRPRQPRPQSKRLPLMQSANGVVVAVADVAAVVVAGFAADVDDGRHHRTVCRSCPTMMHCCCCCCWRMLTSFVWRASCWWLEDRRIGRCRNGADGGDGWLALYEPPDVIRPWRSLWSIATDSCSCSFGHCKLKKNEFD